MCDTCDKIRHLLGIDASNDEEKDAEIKRLRDDVAEALAALMGARVLAECYFDDHRRDPVNNDNYCRIVDWLNKHTALAGKETP